MQSFASRWRGRASVLALFAGAAAVIGIVADGPPGNGYGWGSVAVTAGLIAGLFVVMAYLVRAGTIGRALAASAIAVLVVVLFAASLIGNWAYSSATARALNTVATVIIVGASSLVFIVATLTVRQSHSPHSHAVH